MFDIVAKRKWFFLFSAVIIIPGLIFIGLGGLKLGIDFTGGTIWQVKFQHPTQEIEPLVAKGVLTANGYGDAQVQTAGTDSIIVRMKELKEGSPEKAKLEAALAQVYGPVDERGSQLQTVGPTVGATISERAIEAVAAASIGILLYIAYAFRRAQHPFRFGACAIIAMLHDVLVVIGIFAILGEFFGIEIDALFVTALLTVIGFSVHDTIVVFDRVRENVIRRVGTDFADIVNYSIVQTLVRSLNTSLTVVFTLLALYLFGGETIKDFVLALLIGIISGTYSSIFNASLMLVVWENRELVDFVNRFRPGRPAAAA
ncbi:MAG TPA: protein translocase subunit SecF [Thermomicrobiales bacterium]|nr:protein translocase subunit SecF [Thermomicrobiales bacterium]